MSWRTYSTSSQPYLRHHCEPSPHPETASLPLPPLKRAYEDKNHFVRPSSAERKVFDVLEEVKALRTTNSVPETSIKWLNTSPQYLESPPNREVAFGDFNPFRCRPFVTCCCAAYSCCALPNVCHEQHFGSSGRRDRTRPKNNYFVSQTTLDNIPPNFARMAYERERCNLGAPAENYDDDDDESRKRAGDMLSVGAGICSQGEQNASEVRDSNFQINVDGVYVGCRSRSPRPKEFKTEKKTFERGEVSSKKTQQLGTFCESETSDEERKGKRFRSDPDSVRSQFKTTNHDAERSWQNFTPAVVYIDKRTHPYSKMDLRLKANGFSNVDSQDEIGAFGIRTKERVSSKGHYRQVQSCGSTSVSPEEVKMSTCDGCVGAVGMQGRRLEVTSARFPSFQMGCASEKPRARRCETTSTNMNPGGFISLDSTKSMFMTLMNKMRTQPDTMLCPYCPEAFAQYPDFKKHVQAHQDLPRASADNGAPEMGGHKGELHPSRGKTSQTPSGAPVEPADDEGSKRATSVIMFAGQKK